MPKGMKKCDICLKYHNGDRNHHGNLVRYLAYTENGPELSVHGINKLGRNYLEKLRNDNTRTRIN
jgi:hypothetical protein